MSFGIEFTNDASVVQVSNRAPILVYHERTSFSVAFRAQSTSGSSALVSFKEPVKTQEPPQVFLRYANGSFPLQLGAYTYLQGSPGNWTGFNFRFVKSAEKKYSSDEFEVVICKYTDSLSTEPFGMEVFDENEKLTFKTQDRPVRYSRFTSKWTQNGYEIYSDITPTEDEFISMSQVDRGVIWQVAGGGINTLELIRNGRRTIMLQQAGGNLGGVIQIPGDVKFCIPVCKFPLEQYPVTDYSTP